MAQATVASKPAGEDRLPPQSLDMEQAVLGAMIMDRSAIDAVQAILQPEDFYRDVHRVIFEAIMTLHNRNEPVDILTLQEQLRRQEALDLVGGAPYLIQLTSAVASPANAAYYASRVEGTAVLRRLIQAATQVRDMAYEDFGDVREVVDRAEQLIFSVTQRRAAAYFSSLAEITHKVMDQLDRRSESEAAITGMPTSFRRLDEMTAGFQDSDLIIIAARPSMGKTALALNIAQHVAQERQLPVAIFSLEMSKEQLCLRLIGSEARINAHRLRTGKLRHGEWARVGQACASLATLPIFIDDSPDNTVLDIRSKCRRLMAEQRGLGMVVVDYLQLMRGHKRTENRNQEITEIARSLKALARELSRPVIALSQLSRAVEQRQDKRPQLSDLRESGSIEAEADVVIFIYRESYYEQLAQKQASSKAEDVELDALPAESPVPDEEKHVTELLIAKQRNGPTGKVKVMFLPAFTRFENYDDTV